MSELASRSWSCTDTNDLPCNAGQSVDQHLLSSYQYAILSIILAQFTCKGFADGMEGVVRVVEALPNLQACLDIIHARLFQSV